jgi:rare lipoprotein A
MAVFAEVVDCGVTRISVRAEPVEAPARAVRQAHRERAFRRIDMRCGHAALGALAAALVLAGCAAVSRPGRDGPMASPPPDLAATPDAEPRVEPLRTGGPNKPYTINGRHYVPLTHDAPLAERGLASWYGRAFHGRPTASGEIYDMHAMTAAHPTMALPSYARVRNPANGREVVVRVNDRGPFVAGRIIDLSYTAALRLGVLGGVAPVEVERLTHDAIRSGAWRRDAPADTRLARATSPVPTSPPPPVAATAPAAPTAAAAPSAAQPPIATDAPAVATPHPVAAPAAIETTELPLAAAPAAAASPSSAEPAPFSKPPSAAAPPDAAARGWWVQLGAFRQRDGALGFQQRVAAELSWIAPLLALTEDRSLHRLQAGPYASRDEASAVAARVRDALRLVPVLVERR